jgi:hypothetical protein
MLHVVAITILFITLFLLIAYVIHLLSKEGFTSIKEVGTRYVCTTRNQSFDIRGDIPIPRKAWPVHNSTIGPQHPELCTYSRLE